MKRSNALSTATATALLAIHAPPAAAQNPVPPGHPSKHAEGVVTSANIARGAADVCHLDAAKIKRFEQAVRAFSGCARFQRRMQARTRAGVVDRFAKLKTSNPAQYKKEIDEACPALDRGIVEVSAPQ